MYFQLKLFRAYWKFNGWSENIYIIKIWRVKMEITTFYRPRSRLSLKILSDESESSSSEQEISSSDEEGSQDTQLVGIIGTYDGEINYETVLEHIEFDWEFEEINQEPDHENENELVQAVMKNRSPMFHVRRETIPLVVKAEIVLNCLYKKRSRNEEAQRNEITLRMVDNIISNFNKSNKSKKISENQLIWGVLKLSNAISNVSVSILKKNQRRDLHWSPLDIIWLKGFQISVIHVCRQSVGCSTINSDLAIKS